MAMTTKTTPPRSARRTNARAAIELGSEVVIEVECRRPGLPGSLILQIGEVDALTSSGCVSSRDGARRRFWMQHRCLDNARVEERQQEGEEHSPDTAEGGREQNSNESAGDTEHTRPVTEPLCCAPPPRQPYGPASR